jgi:hypothetical protein
MFQIVHEVVDRLQTRSFSKRAQRNTGRADTFLLWHISLVHRGVHSSKFHIAGFVRDWNSIVGGGHVSPHLPVGRVEMERFSLFGSRTGPRLLRKSGIVTYWLGLADDYVRASTSRKPSPPEGRSRLCYVFGFGGTIRSTS